MMARVTARCLDKPNRYTLDANYMLEGFGQRTALLSRADWRFLLPRRDSAPYRHMALFGGPEGLAQEVLQLGLAHQVSSEASSGSADVVVYLSKARVPLACALRSLAPGGVLYAEVDRRSRRWWSWSPNRIRRALNRAGLTVTTTYWAKPNFESCEMYLPLEAAGAFEWYLRNLYTPITPQRALLASGLRAVT